MATDGTSPETSSLPWWRRPRKLRRQLAGTFVAVALLSVLLVGGLNFVAARQLLDDGTRDQLVGIGEARAHSIELGVDRVLGQVGALAADVAVAEALDDLTEGFAALEEVDLTDDQDEEFEQRYDEIVITPLNEADLGVTVTLGDVAPTDPGRRAAQLAYALVDDADSRRTVADAGDGSDYSVAHARHHAALAKLADTLGLGDLLLVDGSGNVVYSVEKRIDFATNLRTGPHRETTLATTVIDRLARVPVGQASVSDLELYLPGGAQPVTIAVDTSATMDSTMTTAWAAGFSGAIAP